MAAVIGGIVLVGAVLGFVLLGGGNATESAGGTATSSSIGAGSTSTAATQTTLPGSTTSTGSCVVVDVRVTANGPLDDVGIRFNPEFEVTTQFLESGGDAILHVNTGYTDESTNEWVTYSWISGASLPTPEEAAIPNGTYDPASQTETGTETLNYLLDYEEVAGSPIAAPFTASYDPAALVVTGSIVLSDGPHTFTLAAQRTEVLEGPGCPAPPLDTPAP